MMRFANNLYAFEAELFNALAHPARLEILEALREREACVCHLQAVSGQRQAYISQQLNVLRQAGVVASRKKGQWIFYRVSNPAVYELIDRVKEILQAQESWQVVFSPAAGQEMQAKTCGCPHCAPASATQERVILEVSRA